MEGPEALRKAYEKPPHLPGHGAIAQIVALIKPGESVLDVGCAEGYLASYLPANEVWGLDGNPTAVRTATQTCIDAAVVDLNELPVSVPFNRKFDVIVYADVLEHILHPEQVLALINARLRPGGRILVSVPNVALWRVRLNLLFGRFEYTDYGVLDRTHVHLYTFKSAQALLVRAGLAVEQVTGAANMLGRVVARLPILRGLLAIQVVLVATQPNANPQS